MKTKSASTPIDVDQMIAKLKKVIPEHENVDRAVLRDTATAILIAPAPDMDAVASVHQIPNKKNIIVFFGTILAELEPTKPIKQDFVLKSNMVLNLVASNKQIITVPNFLEQSNATKFAIYAKLYAMSNQVNIQEKLLRAGYLRARFNRRKHAHKIIKTIHR